MHHPEIKPQNLQVIWNVQFITVFVPAWMIPPVYHSLRRESIKNASSASAIGVQSVRPTWFEDLAVPKEPTPQTDQGQPQPLHGLKLVIREKVLPMKDQPESPALALLALRGLLAPDAWKCKRAQVSLKATIDVPMLGTIIEQNVMGFWKIPTCQWDGHYTSMAPSGNVVFIDLQPPRTRRHVKRIRHERDSVLGQLAGLRTGPLPVLLWLSTSRQPCMILQFIFLLRLNGCNHLAEAMKALDGKIADR